MEEDEEVRRGAGRKHVPKRALRNKSLVVGFDENDRREFVTGFHKRKKQRRKIAKQQQEKKEREKRIQQRKQRRLAVKLSLGESSELPEEDEQINSAGGVSEQEDGGSSGPVSTVDGTITYEDGDITTVVNTCELHAEEHDDVEIPYQKGFLATQSKTKVHLPVKKYNSFKRINKGNKGKKHIPKRRGKNKKHKQ